MLYPTKNAMARAEIDPTNVVVSPGMRNENQPTRIPANAPNETRSFVGRVGGNSRRLVFISHTR